MAKEKAPAEETKSDKFKRIASGRTEKALDAISNIGGLANPANYEYTPEQVAKIMSALEAELTKLGNRFKNPTAAQSSGFQL